MSTLKFSQFTELTSPATTTYMVGYDGTDNIRIEASELNTTYGLQLSSGGLTSVNLNLLGSDGSNSSIQLIEGSNISLAFSGNTIAISATGTGGSDKNYVHTQGTASATWNIVHNLGKYASVTVVDSNNVVVHGEIEYINTNEVEITFRAAFSGEAYLN